VHATFYWDQIWEFFIRRRTPGPATTEVRSTNCFYLFIINLHGQFSLGDIICLKKIYTHIIVILYALYTRTHPYIILSKYIEYYVARAVVIFYNSRVLCVKTIRIYNDDNNMRFFFFFAITWRLKSPVYFCAMGRRFHDFFQC